MNEQVSRLAGDLRPKQRGSRAKRCTGWEQLATESGGRLESDAHELAHLYPDLTPGELRVAVLVKCGFSSYKIGEVVGIKEESVERVRVRIRQKVGLRHEHKNLQVALIGS